MATKYIVDTRMPGRVISSVLTNQTHSRTITHQLLRLSELVCIDLDFPVDSLHFSLDNSTLLV